MKTDRIEIDSCKIGVFQSVLDVTLCQVVGFIPRCVIGYTGVVWRAVRTLGFTNQH